MTRRIPAVALAAAAVLVGTLGCSGQDGGGVSGVVADSGPTVAEAAPAPPEAMPSAPPVTPPEVATVGTQPATLDELDLAEGPRPVGVRIEAIGVVAEVVPVGVEDDGDMEVPSAEDVGWYRHGPGPGDAGSAVLAAHVDFDGREGAFFRLTELAPGATVEVTYDDGTTARFVVDGTSQVAKEDLAGSGVFDRTGSPRIALVTCGGEFDSSERSYRDNVVVTAVPAA